MKPVKILEDFQGSEAEMVVAIFGTTRKSGLCSLTSNELNFMLTRQRSMLLMVGDMYVTGTLIGNKAKHFDKIAGQKKIKSMMRELLRRVHTSGRFFEMHVVGPEKASGGVAEASGGVAEGSGSVGEAS